MTCLSLRRAVAAGLLLFSAMPFVTAQESKPVAVPTGDPITMKFAAPEIGSVESSTMLADIDMDITVSVNGQEVQQQQSKRKESTKVTRKVLAVTEGRVTKYEVKYTEQHLEMSAEQGDQAEDGAAVGKTFIVEEKADGVAFTDAEGKPLGDEIKSVVVDRETVGTKIRQHHHTLGAFLAKKPVKIGEKIALPEDVAREVFASGTEKSNWKLTVEMTLKEKTTVDGKAAWNWDVAMVRAGEPDAGIKVQTKLKGLATFHAETGRFAMFKGEGPFTLSGEGEQGGQAFNLDGEGSVKSTLTVATEAAKPAEAPKKN